MSKTSTADATVSRPCGERSRSQQLSTQENALACSSCGGGLETTPTADLLRCRYCQQLMLIVRASDVAIVATNLEPEFECAANCLRPGDDVNWQGGTLYLAAEGLAFVPHNFNFGPLERAVVRLTSVAEVELSDGLISDDLTVTTKTGEQWGFRVRDGKSLRDAIARARG